MNTIMVLNLVSAFVIFTWATWCVLSPRVSDGIAGKAVYSAISLSTFAMLVHGADGNASQPAEATLHVCMACLAARHYCLRTCWPHIRNRLFRQIPLHRRESDGY